MKVKRADGSDAHTIEDAKALLEAGERAFRIADDAYQNAASARTAALKQLDWAQHAFDAAVSDMRGFAPEGSRWKTPETQGA